MSIDVGIIKRFCRQISMFSVDSIAHLRHELRALLIFFCRAGRSSGHRVISGEHPRSVPKSTASMMGRLGCATSSRTGLGYNLWVPEQTVFRSYSTQVETDPRVEEGKSEESLIAENEADDQTYELDIGKPVGVLQEPGSGNEVWDQERMKSLQALWRKIESVKQGPQKSVVPMIKEWLNDGYALDKRVLVSILIRLRRRQRYKQALEVIILFDLCYCLFTRFPL